MSSETATAGKDSLLFKVQKQIQLMDQQAREASTWGAAYFDQDTYNLLKQIEKELKNRS